MKILIISPKNKTVFNFRGDLIKDMISHGNTVCVTGPNKDFIEKIYSLGVEKFIEIPLVKDNTSILGDIEYFRKLRTVIKEQKPDLVFSYTIKPVVYGAIASGTLGIKRIYAMVTGLGRVYISDGLKVKLIRALTNTLYKQAFKYCDKVIFQNSDDIAVMTSQKLITTNKTELVNGSGVNMERFTRAELPEQPIFLMVGRIIREKGVMDYCDAARLLKKEVPKARCILLGGFDKSIGALKLEDIRPYIDDGSIELAAEVDDPVAFYNNCSVFVLPSYYREGLPRTILEAMSCGRPVITTDWPGCREPILNGKNGYLVSVKSPEQLAEKMVLLASKHELIKVMGNNAYEHCKKYYSVDVVNGQMRSILKY